MKLSKKLLFFILFSFSVFAQSKLNIFVPQGEKFVKSKINGEGKSFNDLAKLFNYYPDKLQFYYDYDKLDGDIISIGYKLFSEEIVFVVTKGSLNSLTKKILEKYLSNYSWNKVYNAYKIESDLTDGIKNKSLTVEFIASIFKIKKYNSNSTLDINKLGYSLKFKNNLLVKFTTLDGLNKWAKSWKQNDFSTYLSYKKEAERYWGEDSKAIIKEINIQADAWSNTPNIWKNEYIKFHTSTYGIINFKMLLVAHYNEKISKQEFLTINHGRYELVDEFSTTDNYKRTTYKVNNTLYTFSKYGKLLSSYSTK